MKKRYMNPELDVVTIDAADVIFSSIDDPSGGCGEDSCSCDNPDRNAEQT